MNRKLLLISILAVFMLVAISYATVASTETSEIDSQESPLYSIRVRRAIGEKIINMIENVKTGFLGERIFFLPFYHITHYGRLNISPKCLVGYTKGIICVKTDTIGDNPLLTCIFSVGNCCAVTSK